MHRHAAQLPAKDLGLPQMQSGAHLDAQLLHRLDDGCGAPDGVARVVEAGEEPIASGVQLASAEPAQFTADQRVVAREEHLPPAIAEFRGQL